MSAHKFQPETTNGGRCFSECACGWRGGVYPNRNDARAAWRLHYYGASIRPMSGSCPVGAEVCREAHAEVERLRAGIKALILRYDDPKEDLMSPDYYSALAIASYDLDALLNPTEGENR